MGRKNHRMLPWQKCCASSPGSPGSWASCSTVPGSACWSVCGCASKTWISPTIKLWYGMVRARKIASPCCRSPSKPLYSSISRASNTCTRVIWRQAMGLSISPTLWSVNIPMPIVTRYGNTCFLPPGSHATRALASSGGIIPTNRCSNGRCMALYARRASQNLPPAIRCRTLRHNATPH